MEGDGAGMGEGPFLVGGGWGLGDRAMCASREMKRVVFSFGGLRFSSSVTS